MSVRVLVIGSGLRTVGGEQAQLGLRYIEDARTAPVYRLFSLEDRWAALVQDADRGTAVAGELVEVPEERLAEIAAGEPDGIALGPIELEDGRTVLAAQGAAAFLDQHAKDITVHGGFAAYLAARDGDAHGSGDAGTTGEP
jgi:hypothetical protein